MSSSMVSNAWAAQTYPPGLPCSMYVINDNCFTYMT